MSPPKLATILTPELLTDLYINKGMSDREIAEQVGCCGTIVGRWRRKYNIQTATTCDRLKDYTGMVFGSWTVTRYVGIDKWGSRMFECRCVCGTISNINAHNLAHPNKYNMCQDCAREISGQTKAVRYRGLNIAWITRMQESASKRHLAWELSLDYLADMFFIVQKQLCALTKVLLILPRRSHDKNTTASIDRIDSSKDYIEGNVQWVHRNINYMKMTLSQDEFIHNCKLVAANN